MVTSPMDMCTIARIFYEDKLSSHLNTSKPEDIAVSQKITQLLYEKNQIQAVNIYEENNHDFFLFFSCSTSTI